MGRSKGVAKKNRPPGAAGGAGQRREALRERDQRRKKFDTKNQTFAGRSAKRRTK